MAALRSMVTYAQAERRTVILTGLPVFTGPNRLPFGAQIYARRYSDYLLLDFARHLHAHGITGDNTVMPAFA